MKKIRDHLIKHPIFAVFYVLLVCLLFRVIDIFVLRMDERIGEIILSKTAGFIIILLFLYIIGKSTKDIGLHKINFKTGLQLALIQVVIALVFCFGIRYLYIALNDGDPYFTISNEYTILTAIMFVFIGNLINTLMEEGLFRGMMIHSFIKRMSFWKANFLQAILFGLWHITWTIKEYTLGEVTFGAMISNSIIYTIISAIMGFIMGYMYFKTGNLWTSIIWHLVWNCTMNLLVIKSMVFPDDAAVMDNSYMIFWIAFLVYSVVSLVITKVFIRKNVSPTISM